MGICVIADGVTKWIEKDTTTILTCKGIEVIENNGDVF